MKRIRLNIFLAIAALACCSTSSQTRKKDTFLGTGQKQGDLVRFDPSGAQMIIRWAQSNSADAPTAWRQARAYVLTREWAKWSGQPDPDKVIEHLLAEIIRAKSENPDKRFMSAAHKLMTEVTEKHQIFLTQAIPHLREYLPIGTPIRGEVLFAVFITPYAFSWGDGSIVINVTAAFWKWDSRKVLNLLVHELYHNGFGIHNSGSSPEEARTASDLVRNILWQTQNEGMATYVAYQARAADLEVEDYRLLDTPTEVATRFEMLREFLSNGASADESKLKELKARLWEVGTEKRCFYVVGAHMAKSIEDSLGREALIKTIKNGPRSFFNAYARTSPTTEFKITLPSFATESNVEVKKDKTN